jgi:hypothetical protein
MGFQEVGTFRDYAVKHGRLISLIWFQRLIDPPPDAGSEALSIVPGANGGW